MNFKTKYDDPEVMRWALVLWNSYQAMKVSLQKLAAKRPNAKSDDGKEVSIVGESFNNLDGSSRQQIIATATTGESVFLLREPTNVADPNAMAVCIMRGQEMLQMGYLSRADAEIYSTLVDLGVPILGEIIFIGGGDAEFPLRGVRIKIYRFI